MKLGSRALRKLFLLTVLNPAAATSSLNNPLPPSHAFFDDFFTLEAQMAAITAPGACAASAACTVTGTGDLDQWARKSYSETEKTGTVVVVQIINTVLDTTSYSTIVQGVPSNYVPPATNAGGTKIGTMTYTRHGRVSTTTLAYPTPFLKFHNNYTIVGDYQLDTPSGAACVKGQNKTFDIPTNPQPAWGWNDPVWNLTSFYDPRDPLGWGYTIGMENETYTRSSRHLFDWIDLLPDDNLELPHSVAKKCKKGDIASPAVAKAEPNWRVIAHTSVRYEGGNTKAVSSTGGSPRPSDGSSSAGQGVGVDKGGKGGQSTRAGAVTTSGSVPKSTTPKPSGSSSSTGQKVEAVKGGKGGQSRGSVAVATPAGGFGSSPKPSDGSSSTGRGAEVVKGGKVSSFTGQGVDVVGGGKGSSSKGQGVEVVGGGKGGQSGGSRAAASPSSVSGKGPDSSGGTKSGNGSSSSGNGEGGKGPSSSGSIKAAWPLWAVISIGSAVVFSR